MFLTANPDPVPINKDPAAAVEESSPIPPLATGRIPVMLAAVARLMAEAVNT